jgi:hypothetical protein
VSIPPDLQDELICDWVVHSVFTESSELLIQPVCMGLSILLTSGNVQLFLTTALGGSSIFGPMIKFHAVGQTKYTKVYITVYIHAATFGESSRRIFLQLVQ